MAVNLAGDRGPPQQRRRGAGQAANNDVLRCSPLQKQRVNERVTHQRGEGQPGRQGIHTEQENRHTRPAQERRKAHRAGVAHPALSQRTMACARHAPVYLLIHDMVDGGRRRRAQSDAQVAENQRIERHPAGHGHAHADNGGEHHQRDDPGLGQLFVVAPARARGAR